MLALLVTFAVALAAPAPQGAPAPARPESAAVTAAQIGTAVGQLATIEFPVRMEAARTIRRAPADIAVPALVQAAAGHADGYVRFRALVLLSGFNDPRTRDVMIQALGAATAGCAAWPTPTSSTTPIRRSFRGCWTR
jgi:hypothetical protein